MVDPLSMGIIIGVLTKSAPEWFHSLQEALLSKEKEKIQGFLDEKKHLRE